MAVYFPKKKHREPVPVQYLLLMATLTDFNFGFQQHVSLGIFDFNTIYNSFQEQDDQQRFLQISVSLFPFTAKYPGSQTEY